MNPSGAPRWSSATIALHWLSALVVLALLALGLAMVHAVDDPARRYDFYQLHKSLGFVALALLPGRLIARLASRAPPSPPLPAWMQRARAMLHGALYLLTLIATLSGWLLASATILPIPTRFFNMFVVPNIAASSAALAEQMTLIHIGATWLMLAVIALHVGAALKHQFVDRDCVLQQIVPRWLAGR